MERPAPDASMVDNQENEAAGDGVALALENMGTHAGVPEGIVLSDDDDAGVGEAADLDEERVGAENTCSVEVIMITDDEEEENTGSGRGEAVDAEMVTFLHQSGRRTGAYLSQ